MSSLISLLYTLANEGQESLTKINDVAEGIEAFEEKGRDAKVVISKQCLSHLFGGSDERS